MYANEINQKSVKYGDKINPTILKEIYDEQKQNNQYVHDLINSSQLLSYNNDPNDLETTYVIAMINERNQGVEVAGVLPDFTNNGNMMI